MFETVTTDEHPYPDLSAIFMITVSKLLYVYESTSRLKIQPAETFMYTESQRTWSLSQGESGTRWDAPWTGCQSIAGHTITHTHPLKHHGHFWTRQSACHACLWTGGGNRSTRRKPPQHGENVQSSHTRPRRESNPGVPNPTLEV
ncbi:hypothetical protein AMELA_G00017660 [Ameiurus melas]|uniref:Uncharacterized protein n=1 Tax=Ameiurus melas TaxID=219545 RepID=A0A7J6BB09_AMEME|nr:hypothetical protein AMELA_G00017660 [Ameiurus melas]